MTINNEINTRHPLAAGNFWRVLKLNKAAMIGAIVLAAFLSAAIFAFTKKITDLIFALSVYENQTLKNSVSCIFCSDLDFVFSNPA